ncbi:hypothetical protein E0Z10_g1151 [Xylaria hypoxylon]|uniref:Mannan endo-1,4-beta-mannosidase A n=1 Tax=Xylaria hypoxylon TaxID=37992 RepID=A0A4Z0Z9L1_9PEZI|nr:hypothetical protein E0Z10_g1151 [Xylaria hypoxylon]
MKAVAAGLIALAGVVSADVALWGQCGGTGYSGETTCVSSANCQYQNEYYSQAERDAEINGNDLDGDDSDDSDRKCPDFYDVLVNQRSECTNSYWIGFLTNNADVDTSLDQLKNAGLKVLRVWGFNDVTTTPQAGTVWFQKLSATGSTINTGANGLQRLDYVVSAAEKRGIKLIINFVNNWSDYGGMPAYVTAFGGTQTSWYTNTAAQAQYRAYIKAVVSRYASSAAVFAWELANEPRCKGCATSVITQWASSTSAYVKSLDSKHMVTLGDEGFGLATGSDKSYPFQYSEGVDFEANLKISTLDFGTFHLYPESWGTTSSWGNTWITAHGAACKAAGKPCLFEEYGMTSDHCTIESAWQKTALASSGIAGDLFWQLGTTLSFGQTHNDGHTIYTGSSDWTCLVTNHVAAIS